MAGRYNEILVGRYNRFLQKFLSMKGGPPAPQLASDLSAVWALFHGAENRYLEGWERFGQNAFAGAVAANLSGVRLRNPALSNVVMVVERLSFATLTAQKPSLKFGSYITDLGTIDTGGRNSIDKRTRPSSSGILSHQNSAPTLPGEPSDGFTLDSPNDGTTTIINWIITDNQELTILPGDGLEVFASAVNLDIQLAVLWRERALEDSERT